MNKQLLICDQKRFRQFSVYGSEAALHPPHAAAAAPHVAALPLDARPLVLPGAGVVRRQRGRGAAAAQHHAAVADNSRRREDEKTIAKNSSPKTARRQKQRQKQNAEPIAERRQKVGQLGWSGGVSGGPGLGCARAHLDPPVGPPLLRATGATSYGRIGRPSCTLLVGYRCNSRRGGERGEEGEPGGEVGQGGVWFKGIGANAVLIMLC
jgi:hypothetical protein